MTARVAQLRDLTANPWLRALFLGLSLAFLFLVLRTYWADMRTAPIVVRGPWVALSLFGLLPCLVFEVFLWRLLLGQIGWALPFRRAAGVWFLSNLARYIPGNIWQFLGMMELGAESGVPRTAVLAGVVLHQLFSNFTGLLIGLPALITAAGWSPDRRAGLLLLLAAGLVLALGPWALSWGGRMLSALLRPPSGAVRLRAGRLLAILLGYCLYWAWLGAAFYALGRGLGATPGPLVGWASAFPASYVAGYLSLLTPSGVGVREGVLALLLAPVAGAGLAGVVALVARLWLTLAELFAAAVALALNRSLVWSGDGSGTS